MRKTSRLFIAAWILIVVTAICYAPNSDPWDGTTWNILAPDKYRLWSSCGEVYGHTGGLDA